MRRGLSIFVIFLLLAVMACDSKFPTTPDPTLNEVLEIGKSYLRNGDGGNASDAFEAAIKIDDTSVEAKYGLLIARNMQFLSLMSQLISFVGGDLSAQTMPPANENGLQQKILAQSTDPIGDYIQEFLAESADVWYRDAEDLYAKLLDSPDPFFKIDHFAMGINGLIEIQYGGRLDRSDLQYFGVLNSFVRFLVDFLLAYDLNYDFFSLVIPPLDFTLPTDLTELTLDDILTLIEQLQPIFDLLESLLTYEENPDFLTLKEEGGVERMQAAGIEMGQLFYRLDLLIKTAYAETGGQESGTVHFVDINHNGRGDRLVDALYLPGFGQLSAELVNGLDSLALQTAPAFWDTSTMDVDPDHDNPFYIAFANELLTALDVLPFFIDQEMLAGILEGLGVDPSFLPEDFEIPIAEIPYILPIPVGPFFAQPSPTGLKDLLWDVLDIWNLVAELLPMLAG